MTGQRPDRGYLEISTPTGRRTALVGPCVRSQKTRSLADGETPMSGLCLVCSSPLPGRSATGRPAEYCSQACRRAREYAIKRTNAALERAEATLTEWRHDCDLNGQRHPGKVATRDWWAAEVTRLERHLSQLLAGEPDRNVSPGGPSRDVTSSPHPSAGPTPR